MMQVAIIVGGMLARKFGSTAPWLILIGLKTLADFQRPAPATAPASGPAVACGGDVSPL
jgi:hypothetical protein